MAVQMLRSVVAALLTIVLCLQQLRSGNGEGSGKGSGEGTILPDTISIVIEYGDFLTIVQKRPLERDYPLHGSLYVIQESVDFPLYQFNILCYNLESNNATDAEFIFANPNITDQSFDFFGRDNFATLRFGMLYPSSFNGNVTCRSRATGKASTVYIANATESGAFVIPVTQSPVTILPGDNATFTYRIGLANDSLDVISVIKVIPVNEVDIEEPVLVYLGNSFYDVQFTSVCCNLEFYLAFNRVQVSPRANIRITGAGEQVMFMQADLNVSESDLPVQFEVLLWPSQPPPLDRNITVQIRTISNTATGGADYDDSVVNVTFPVGDTSYTAFFEISIYNDTLVEPNEVFTLAIVNSTLPEGVSLGMPNELVVTIVDGNSLNVIRQPENQIIYRGQNAFFHCLLSGTNGELIPVQWGISEDGPSENITMNSTDYLILPPANSVLVVVKPTFDLFVTCRGGFEGFIARLGVIGSRDCRVDNGNCEDSCIESACMCSNNQTLIQTSCVSQSTYFTIYDEVYEDSDIFIHHPLYHTRPFQIICNSDSLDEQGEWVVQAFDSNTTIAFSSNSTVLNNSSVNASAELLFRETPRGISLSSILMLDQLIEGYFTCIINNVSHTIEVLTGGKPLLELLTPEPVYITNLFYEVAVRAFIVNSFGKTVRAGQSDLAVTFVNGTDRTSSRIRSYSTLTGDLSSVLPLPRNIDLRTELGSSVNEDVFVEISLISAANFITNISFSPVYAEIINISSTSGQNIFAAGQLILDCFTIPNDLSVVWAAFNFDDSEKQLAGDPCAIIQSTEYGSRLTLMNTTVEDSGYYTCNSVERFVRPDAPFIVTIVPDTISIVIEYGDFPTINNCTLERDYPLHGSLYVIQESVDFPLGRFNILCYNLESNSATDTEFIFANPSITNQSFNFFGGDNFAALRFSMRMYPSSFNGNVTCRSRATGKASTIYIANATESGAFVIPVTQSPVTILAGDNATFKYRIGLANDSLDVISVIKVIPVNEVDIEEPVLVYLGNSFYDVQFTSVCCNLEFYLAFNRVQVSPRANIRITVPVTTINGSDPNVLVGQTVELFCTISLPGITAIPNNINYTVNWRHNNMIVSQSTAIGSLVHTFIIEDVNSNRSGRYTCGTDLSGSSNSFNLLVLTDPVSIGYDPILVLNSKLSPNIFNGSPLIIPDGNVFNSLPEPIPRFKRGGGLVVPLMFNCYTTRGHENPVWEFPKNSSFYSRISMISPYQTALFLNIPLSSELFDVEKFVCRSPNNISSSVIVTNNPSYIQPLSLNPVMVKYFQNVTLSFQAAGNSNGISNEISQISLKLPGNNEQLLIISARNNSQVFAHELIQAGSHTEGNYTASIMFEDFMRNATVEVIVESPKLVATQTTIHALLGENVSVNCIPSDSNLELQWVIVTSTDMEMIPPMVVEGIVPVEGTGSGMGGSGVFEDGGSKFDDEGSAKMIIPRSDLLTRLQYQKPIHQLTLVNTLMTDNGYFMCQIKPAPDDDINISQRITLNIFTNVINIGYSPELLIPENNVINFMAIEETGFISCFTTQRYGNPIWMISSNNFSTVLLSHNGTLNDSFGGSIFTITIVKISLYQSNISINTNGVDFTGNLTCLSQDNPQAQYSVIITTNDLYVQLLSPNPILVEFFQRFSLTFLAAQMSNGISNEIPGAMYIVRSPTGQLLSVNTLENSTQIFVLDLEIATQETVGNYTIPYRGNDDIIVEVILQLPTITTTDPSIGALNGENVTFVCIPSDSDIEMLWTYETVNGNRGNVTVGNLMSRFLSDSPLLHRLVLLNATYSDAGIYQCIPRGPIGDVVSEQTRLNVLPNFINIGYSPNLLIPDNNVINLPGEGGQYRVSLSCYTTQGYENPVWMISNNNFSSMTLKESGTFAPLPGVGNITVIRRSLYQSEILVEINNVEFTGNLICQSQNNASVQHTVVITTSSFYVQPITQISMMVRYFQPINLTFRVAQNSNGTFNEIERLTVFQYDSNGESVGRKLAERLEGSTQIFVLDLGQAEPSTSGSYLIFFMGNTRNATVGIIDTVVVPRLTANPVSNEFLNGETITLECMPSVPDTELYWTYDTVSGRGNITTDTLSRSPFLSSSSLLHQLILPIANVSDTGSYSCVVPGPLGERQTISFIVVPACGSLDRLSLGVLWPIVEIGETVEMFCSEVNPSFGFGPYATRKCRDDGTWSRVDTSQCIIRPMQESAIVLSSIYVEVDTINTTSLNAFYEMELKRSYNDSSLISTTTILSDRLYVQVAPTFADGDIIRIQKKRQISTRYSLLAPVIFTVNIMSREILTSNVTETVRSIVTQTVRNIDALPERDEVVGFNPVDVCECVSNSGNLQQSPVSDVCIGASGSPCRCNSSNCMCNEGYTGNGLLCARDTDRDTFPDVNITTCSLPRCLADRCPLIFTEDNQDGSACQPLPNTTAHCPQGRDTKYGIMWPSTLTNMTATNSCPSGSGTAKRFCDSNGQWATPVVSRCTSYDYVILMALMQQVENGTVDLGHLTSNLAMVSNRTDDRTSAYPADLMNANMLLSFSLNSLEENRDILASNDSDQLVQDIADCFSNILSSDNDAGWMELEETNPGQSQMLLMNSERFSLLLAESLEVGETRNVISENIEIVAQLVNANNTGNVTFPDRSSNFSPSNSISIPASFILQRSIITGINPVPIVNIIYENIENILPIVNSRPISQVLSSQVTNTSITSSDDAIELMLQYSNTTNDSMPVCGYWNFSLNEGSGGWDTEGVSVISIDNNTATIICSSTHLTSFAVLVDVSGGHGDISDPESRALSIVSYFGCGISIICLLIAIIILVYYRNTLLKGIHNFIHLNLAIALLLALIIFVSGIEAATENDAGCTIVAALLHYFFTAVFTWMLCEGIMLYFLLVKVFNTGLGQRELFYFALGWGIPIPIVAISVGVAHDQYGHEEYCWIDHDDGAIWAFVGPMLAIIILNVIFLLLALRSLYISKRGKLTGEEASGAAVVRTILKATVILLPLLGITWVFGILAVNQESSAFAWIFTILNTLQGLFILVFHVLRNEKIWQKISSCWKDNKYSFIPSSQRSSTASRSAKIKKSIQTTSTTDPSSTLELKSKLDTSNFQESSGMESESKSFGIEASVVEKDDEQPPITDADVEQQNADVNTKQEVAIDMKQEEEEAVTTTTFSMDITVPSSNNESDL